MSQSPHPQPPGPGMSPHPQQQQAMMGPGPANSPHYGQQVPGNGPPPHNMGLQSVHNQMLPNSRVMSPSQQNNGMNSPHGPPQGPPGGQYHPGQGPPGMMPPHMNQGMPRMNGPMPGNMMPPHPQHGMIAILKIFVILSLSIASSQISVLFYFLLKGVKKEIILRTLFGSF